MKLPCYNKNEPQVSGSNQTYLTVEPEEEVQVLGNSPENTGVKRGVLGQIVTEYMLRYVAGKKSVSCNY